MSRKAGTKPHHLAPLLLPLVVLSGSVAASGSCGAQSAFLKGSLPTASISTSQNTPYQIEAFAPLEVANPTPSPTTSRPAFNPLAPLDPNAPPQVEDPYGALAPFFD